MGALRDEIRPFRCGPRGWIAVRPPENAPFHLDGGRMILLDEIVKRTSAALGRLGA